MADAFPDRLAAEVSARRRALRLTQSDVAGLAGVSERFIRSVERGKASVQLDSVLALLGTLGLELQLSPRPSTAVQGSTRAQPPPDPHPGNPREGRR